MGWVDLAGLDSGPKFTDAPGGTPHGTFAGGTATTTTNGERGHHHPTRRSATVTVTGYTGVFDVAAHGPRPGLRAALRVRTWSTLSTLGQSLTNGPGGTAESSFAGNCNYNPKSGSVEIVINKAYVLVKVDGAER